MTSSSFTAALRASVAVASMLLAAPVLAQEKADAALIERGEYLARAGDCVACHTAPGGKAMAGGLALPTPIGVIISSNISSSKTYGVGAYTFAQFDAALRRGVRADGARLYPAMPYTAYALMTDDDVRALYAYFMNAVDPVDVAPTVTRLPFPFNIRLSMAAWSFLFLNPKSFTPDPLQSAEWNRGSYLARGLAHCGACHTPRNVLMAEKASQEFGGGSVGAWYAPNITSDVVSGIGAWSTADLTAYMKIGHVANKAQAAGPMAEAIDNSLQYLDAADLTAMAVFLKSVTGIHNAADSRPAFAWNGAAVNLSEIRGVNWPENPDAMTGLQLYDGHCATCHQAGGEGSFEGALPPLIHNTSVGRSNSNNLVMVILEGVRRQPDVFMPAFDKTLSDKQIVSLGNFILQQYGDPKARVTLDQVKTAREGGEKSFMLPAVRAAMGGVAFILVLAALLLFRRRRTKASGLSL